MTIAVDLGRKATKKNNKMTRGIVVMLTTPSHKFLKLVYIDNQLDGITIPNQMLAA